MRVSINKFENICSLLKQITFLYVTGILNKCVTNRAETVNLINRDETIIEAIIN